MRISGPNARRKSWLATTLDFESGARPFGVAGSSKIAAPPMPTDGVAATAQSAQTSGFQATIPLGRNTERTHNGYLICRGVVIARLGPVLYRPFEIQYQALPQSDGWVHVIRTEEDVFDPIAMASFEHVPVTLRHPSQMLNASTWREAARGYMQNIRRGEDAQADLLLGDLVVTDKEAVDAILNQGFRQVSNGYYNEYTLISKENEPPVYSQTEIRGNHIAIVPKGRCGDACTLTLDGAPEMAATPAKKPISKITQTRKLVDSLVKKYPAITRDALEEAVEEAQEAAAADGENKEIVITVTPEGDVQAGGDPAAAAAEANQDDAVAEADAGGEGAEGDDPENPDDESGEPEDGDDPYQDQIDDLTTQIGDMAGEISEMKEMVAGLVEAAKASAAAPAVTTDAAAAGGARTVRSKQFTVRAARSTPKAATTDAALSAEFTDTKHRAEVLAPGIAVPTMDSATTVEQAKTSLCQLRRDALKAAYGKAETKPLIDTYAAGSGGKAASLDAMSCDSISPIFFGVSETIMGARGIRRTSAENVSVGAKSIKEIQAEAEAFYARQPVK